MMFSPFNVRQTRPSDAVQNVCQNVRQTLSNVYIWSHL